ncbi:3-isopropylmalate dehydratase small subunit (plasmid) [Paraburkholderia sp. PREW-6R]|uniref:3-isopropylmalate dehydratase small subunit n=1 Tax=Paraburkholderia sp. PREW-6R TaxID=3141544 RepID=UPI0031F4B09B
MEAFTRISAIAAPLMQINIDTDQIIPTPYLLRTSEAGLSEGLFANWRKQADGSPDPGFILNRAPWSNAHILLAGRNFGCGSSREAAPRALRQAGFRVVIAPSFGEIFFSNCFRNGLLPVRLPEDAVRDLAQQMQDAHGHAQIAVDLDAQTVRAPDGQSFGFETPPALRTMLLNGIDEIDVTLQRREKIDAYRSSDRRRRPWAYDPRSPR